MNSFNIGSILVLEPYVLLSDVITSIACFYCYFSLKSRTVDIEDGRVSVCWRRFFLFEGISFLVGGLAHGLYAYFGDILHLVGWYASIIGVFYFAWGVLKASGGYQNVFSYILLVAMASSAVLSTIFKAFSIVVGYSFLSMFIIVFINAKSKIMSFKKRQSKGILMGTLLFIISSTVHIFGINILGIAKQITSHLIIAAGILFFRKGCLDTIMASWQKYRKIES